METEEEITEMATKKDTRTWRDKYESSKKYEEANVVRKAFKLYKKSDADVIKAIDDAPAKAEFLRNAIRYYIAAGCPEVDKQTDEAE